MLYSGDPRSDLEGSISHNGVLRNDNLLCLHYLRFQKVEIHFPFLPLTNWFFYVYYPFRFRVATGDMQLVSENRRQSSKQ